MGAISADLPAFYVPGGPMLKGNWCGTTLGSGTDAWKYWAERCAGNCNGRHSAELLEAEIRKLAEGPIAECVWVVVDRVLARLFPEPVAPGRARQPRSWAIHSAAVMKHRFGGSSLALRAVLWCGIWLTVSLASRAHASTAVVVPPLAT